MSSWRHSLMTPFVRRRIFDLRRVGSACELHPTSGVFELLIPLITAGQAAATIL